MRPTGVEEQAEGESAAADAFFGDLVPDSDSNAGEPWSLLATDTENQSGRTGDRRAFAQRFASWPHRFSVECDFRSARCRRWMTIGLPFDTTSDDLSTIASVRKRLRSQRAANRLFGRKVDQDLEGQRSQHAVLGGRIAGSLWTRGAHRGAKSRRSTQR